MEGDSNEDSTGGRQVIARAAAVLRVLAEEPQGSTISQIAKLAQLPRTTVHRIVVALEAQGLAITGPSGVRLGSALMRLAATAHRDIVALARPSMEALSRRTRETVDLCVRRGLHAISIAQYQSDQELRVVCSVGTAFPIHSSAHGKAILSQLSDLELRAMFTNPPEKRTQGTRIRIDELIAQMAKVRSEGIAVEIEEHAVGVCGLGIYLETGSPEHHAISLAVPAVRFRNRFEDLRSALIQCKAEIESLSATSGQSC